MITTSCRDPASFSIIRRRSLVRSSAGFGGVGPPGNSLRFCRRVGWIWSSRLEMPARMLLKPEVF